MKKVLFIDTVHPLIREELTSMGYLCDEFPSYSRQDYESIAAQYTGIIIRSKIKIDREFLDKAVNLRFIGRVGSGLENIDVEYACGKGIVCLNSPEGNRDAVGEHCIGLLLNLLNHISRADRQVREGKWIREGNRGQEIKGKTVAIIGYGNTGGAFARKLKGFEADVIAFDKYKKGFSDEFVEEVPIDRIFSVADILSLHVPLTEETYYMVNEGFLSRFRKNIFLLNTSRGSVVSTSALVGGLKSGRILGAGLDVLEQEDASFESLGPNLPEDLKFLFSTDRALLTPHIAGWTAESNVKLARVLVEKIRDWESGFRIQGSHFPPIPNSQPPTPNS